MTSMPTALIRLLRYRALQAIETRVLHAIFEANASCGEALVAADKAAETKKQKHETIISKRVAEFRGNNEGRASPR
jgi:hypothetical protein